MSDLLQVSFALHRLLSHERMIGYSTGYARSIHADPLAIYLWNLSLAESFYPLLHTIEIGFRNSISNAIAKHCGDTEWLLRSDIITAQDKPKVLKSVQNLKRYGKPINSDNLIADLSLGFWISLLDKRYEQTLWHRICKQTFPYMPRRIRTRKIASSRFSMIRDIRNRIFHFEPIWHREDLPQNHADIIEAINWIDPKLKFFIQKDRFNAVYQNGLKNIDRNKAHVRTESELID